MIIVTSLREAPSQLAVHGARRAISILSPETPHPDFEALSPGDHLRLSFHDIVEPESAGLRGPQEGDARKLISFIRGWDAASPMLIHCWAGISRSTAAAYTALCLMREEESERHLAMELREASPSATPNRLIISQVDDLLGRKGRMVDAVAAIGRGADAFEGRPFMLRIK